jgi:hypothetical protein
LVGTLWERVQYLLTISGETGQLELLRWTAATGLVSAGPSVGLPQTVLDLLTRRAGALLAGVPAQAAEDQVQLLPTLCNVRDGAGRAVATVNVQDGYHALELGELEPGVTYYVWVSVPHSVGAFVC